MGVFGGTFDPPHVGHLLLASDAVERLPLDLLVFVPAAQQPLKGRAGAAPEDRLAMTRLLAADDPRFVVDPVEVERGGLSFMVDTLRDLRRRHAGATLFLLLGADAVVRVPEWRAAEEVLAAARLVVVARAGEGPGSVPPGVAAMAAAGAGAPLVLDARRVDISSTEIRARLAAGRPVRGFVCDAVAAHIAARGLYRGMPAVT